MKATATNTNWPVTAGRATDIHTGLPRHAPTKPKNAWDRLKQKAKMRANTPSSGAIDSPAPKLRGGSCGSRTTRGSLLFQRGGHFRRHVFLVVLGEDLVGHECPVGAHGPMGD